MAKVTLQGSINPVNGQYPEGPFSFTFQYLNGCSSNVTFIDGSGNTGSNSIKVETANPIAVVTAEFSDTECVGDEELGNFILTVSNGKCDISAPLLRANPCFGLEVSIVSLGFNQEGNHLLSANIGGGNAPFSYLWNVISGDAIIVGSNSSNIVEVKPGQSTIYFVQVNVTDVNECRDLGAMSFNKPGIAPVLEDQLYVMNCDGSEDLLIDILQIGDDADGTINVDTISIVELPVNGSIISTVNGVMTYQNSSGLDDEFKLTVKDNQGNVSNTAMVRVSCDVNASPIANQDTATTPSGTQVIVPVLTNDTDADGTIVSLEIIVPPRYGTGYFDALNQYVYTPNAGFEGVEYVRYRVLDNDGNSSSQSATLGLVAITVEKDCNAHTAGIEVTCNLTTEEFTASASGSIDNINTDTIEVDTGGGYLVGSSATLSPNCASIIIYNSGSSIGNSVTDFLRSYTTGPNAYRARYEYDSAIAASVAQGILDFIQNIPTNGIFRITSDSGANPEAYFARNITNVISTTTYLELFYTIDTYTGSCEANYNADTDVQNTHTRIINNVDGAGVYGISMDEFGYYTYGEDLGTIRFRRTITRTGSCPDVVVEVEVNVTDNTDVCGSYQVASLQSGGGTGLVTQETGKYEVVTSNPDNSQINSLTANGS